jgi:hypothetical protein
VAPNSTDRAGKAERGGTEPEQTGVVTPFVSGIMRADTTTAPAFGKGRLKALMLHIRLVRNFIERVRSMAVGERLAPL